jgi:membrane-associated phospholipid phosphatase
VATYVAASRVQDQRHFPSDVIFGAALGIAVGRALDAAHSRGLVLEPMVTDGGGLGLSVTVVWGAGRK